MSSCPSCGTLIALDAKECPSCGQSIVAHEAAPVIRSRGARQSDAVTLGGLGIIVAVVAFLATFFLPKIRWEAIPWGPLSTEKVVAQSEPSVAFIKGEYSAGTGFLVKPGIVVTNKHVLLHDFLDNVRVEFPSASTKEKGPHVPTLLYEDPNRDLAFLRVGTSLPALHVAGTHTFTRGQEVIVIGNPSVSAELTLNNAVSRGVLSTEASIKGRQYYQLGISINPGNSGGPVLDGKGQVIGVITLKAAEKEGLAFCIPLSEVRAAMSVLSAIKPEDAATTQAMHRARTAFFLLHLKAACQSVMMGSRAIGLGQLFDNLTDALRKQLEGVSDESLEKQVLLVNRDEHLSIATRKQFLAFWLNYRDMKECVDRPRGSILQYRSKYDKLAAVNDALSKSLESLLGFKE